MSRLTITGEIDESGKLYLFNQSMLDDFKKKNNGKKLIITFESEDSQSLQLMIKYYYAKIVPDCKEAFFKVGIIKTDKEVDYYLRSLSPIMKRKTLSDLTKEEMYFYMDHVKNIVLEEFEVVIEDMRAF